MASAPNPALTQLHLLPLPLSVAIAHSFKTTYLFLPLVHVQKTLANSKKVDLLPFLPGAAVAGLDFMFHVV